MISPSTPEVMHFLQDCTKHFSPSIPPDSTGSRISACEHNEHIPLKRSAEEEHPVHHKTICSIISSVVSASTSTVDEKDETTGSVSHSDTCTLDVCLHCCICFRLAAEAMHTECCPICICRSCTEDLFQSVRVVSCPSCGKKNERDDFVPDYRTSRVARTMRKCGFCTFEGTVASLDEHVNAMCCDGLRNYCWQLITTDDLAEVPLPDDEIFLHEATLACCVRAAGTPFLARLSPRVHETLDEFFFRKVCSVPFVLQFAGKDLRDKESFIEFMVTVGENASVIKYASDRLRCNTAFAQKLISKFWPSFRYFHTEVLDFDMSVLAMQQSEGKVLQFIPVHIRESYPFQELMCSKFASMKICHFFTVDERFETELQVPSILSDVRDSNAGFALNVIKDNSLKFVWRYLYMFARLMIKTEAEKEDVKVDFEPFHQMVEDDALFCSLFLQHFSYNREEELNSAQTLKRPAVSSLSKNHKKQARLSDSSSSSTVLDGILVSE